MKVSNVNDLWGKEFMDVASRVETKLTSIRRGNVVVVNNKKLQQLQVGRSTTFMPLIFFCQG